MLVTDLRVLPVIEILLKKKDIKLIQNHVFMIRIVVNTYLTSVDLV